MDEVFSLSKAESHDAGSKPLSDKRVKGTDPCRPVVTNCCSRLVDGAPVETSPVTCAGEESRSPPNHRG